MDILIIAMVTMIAVMTNPIGQTGLIVRTDLIDLINPTGPIDPLIYRPDLIGLRINPEEVWCDLRVGVKSALSSVISSVISDTSRW
jgi:hypothetical protein